MIGAALGGGTGAVTWQAVSAIAKTQVSSRRIDLPLAARVGTATV
jgi:hypothetical protein